MAPTIISDSTGIILVGGKSRRMGVDKAFLEIDGLPLFERVLAVFRGTFDRIIMVDALHHVLDQQQTGNELWRVLTPGGRLVIVEPDIHKISVKILALGEKLLLMRSHFLSGEEIGRLFSEQEAQLSVTYDEGNTVILIKK